MSKKPFYILFSLLCFLCLSPLYAQRTTSLGLVLSGGGAKGLAHIGVIKALEEEEIPIDYICGTSMGAIIGGLYASGYSVEEIEQIFLSPTFDEILSNKIDKRIEPLYYKTGQDAGLLKLRLDIDNKMKASLPLGLVNPILLDYSFLNMFSSASKVCKEDFGKLMIPFFCIATNINDHCQQILDSGDLGRAIRASATLPVVFTPVEIDGKMMCDGGAYNNFPAKELIEKYRPDVVIGSKVVNNYDAPNDDDFVLYMENLITHHTAYEIPSDSSVLIDTYMRDISVMDFNKKQECIDRGYACAKKHIGEIRRLIADSLSKEQLQTKRKDFNQKKIPLKIGNIVIRGVSESQKYFFERLLTQNLHDAELTLDNLKNNYVALYRHPNIKSMSPYVYYDHTIRSYVLELDIKAKRVVEAKFGGMFSSSPINYVFLGANYNLIRKNAWQFFVNGYVGRYYRSFMYSAGLHVPNRNLPFYLKAELVVNDWNLYRSHNSLFDYSSLNYLQQMEYNGQIKLAIPLSRMGEMFFKVGVGQSDQDYYQRDYIVYSDTADNTKFNNLVLGVSRIYNSLDDDYLPRQGMFLKFDINCVHGKEKFEPGNHIEGYELYEKNHTWLELSMSNKIYFPITHRYSMGFEATMCYSFQNLFYNKKSSLLNAFSYKPTLETYTSFYPEYRSTQYLAGGWEQIYLALPFNWGSLNVKTGAYLFAPIRQIYENKQKQPYYGGFFERVYPIASVSTILSTNFGNLTLSLSYHRRDHGNNQAWNLSIGFGKIVFNNKNLNR